MCEQLTRGGAHSRQLVIGTMDDSGLTDRLNRLRGSQQPKLPLSELQERVAKLKGLDPAQYSAPPITVYTAPDRRSDQQKVDDLLSHLMDETCIDQQVAAGGRRMSDAEMEERLRRLRGDRRPLPHDDWLPDSDRADEIVRKALAEAQLPLSGLSAADDEDDEMDEMVWCVICNDDANVCCQGCDNDLYCADCFTEFHKSEKPAHLVTVPVTLRRRPGNGQASVQ